jgi:3-hydroxy-9,10-secoandrosta-1,3,5(10)-triene-9,17-dione monooxygenase
MRDRTRMTTTSAQRAITDQELLASAARLQPLLRESTYVSEATRTLPDEVIDGLTDAGFFRLLKPSQFSGYEVSQRTILDVLETLRQANASAAWLVSIGATAASFVRCASERLQSEIFCSPDTLIAGSLNPGTARRVDGGLSVSGSWPFSSRAPHADWVTLGAAICDEVDRNGGPYVCSVPASHVRLRETWHTLGMRGTPNQTFLTEKLFVPEHRTIALSSLMSSETSLCEAEHQLPLATLATLLLIGPLLGLGEAAAGLVIDTAPSKSMHHGSFVHQGDSVGVSIQLAEARLKLRTARMHAFAVADALDEGTTVGGDPGYPLRALARARCGYAAQQVLDAIEILTNVYGAAGFAESSPMQQYWHDASVAARHAALNSYLGYEVYGKSLLGVPGRVPPLV